MLKNPYYPTLLDNKNAIGTIVRTLKSNGLENVRLGKALLIVIKFSGTVLSFTPLSSLQKKIKDPMASKDKRATFFIANAFLPWTKIRLWIDVKEMTALKRYFLKLSMAKS